MNSSKLSKSMVDEKNDRIKITHSIFLKYTNNDFNTMRTNQFINFAKDCINTENTQDIRNFEILYFKYGGSGSINFDQFCCLLVEISCLIYPELVNTDEDKALSLFYKNYVIQMNSKLNQYLLDPFNEQNHSLKLQNFNKTNHISLNINTENYFIVLIELLKKEKHQFKQILNLHNFLLNCIYKSCIKSISILISQQQKNVVIQQILIKVLKKFLICPSAISQSEIISIVNIILKEDLSEHRDICHILGNNITCKEDTNNITTLRNLSNSIYNSKINSDEEKDKSHYTSRSFSKRKKMFTNNFSHTTNSQFKDSELLNNFDSFTYDKFIITIVFCIILEDIKMNMNNDDLSNEYYKPKDYFKRQQNLEFKKETRTQEIFYAERFHSKFKLFYCINKALEGIINGVNNHKFLLNKSEVEKFERFEGDILVNYDINDSLVEKQFLNQSSITSLNDMKNLGIQMNNSIHNLNYNDKKIDQIDVLNQINFERNYKNNFIKIFIYYSNKNCDDYPFFFMNMQDTVSYLKDCNLIDMKGEQTSKNQNDYYTNKSVNKYNSEKNEKNLKGYFIDYNKLNSLFSKICRKKQKNDNSYDYYSMNKSKYDEYNKYNSMGKVEKSFIKRLDFKGFVTLNYQISNLFQMEFKTFYSLYVYKIFCKIMHENYIEQIKSNDIDLSEEGSNMDEKLLNSISKVNLNIEESKNKKFNESLNFNYCSSENHLKDKNEYDNINSNRIYNDLNENLNELENNLTYRGNYNQYQYKDKNMSESLNYNSIYSDDNSHINVPNNKYEKEEKVRNVKSSYNTNKNPIKNITIKLNPKIQNFYNEEQKVNINKCLNDEFNKQISSYRSNISSNSNFFDKSMFSDLNKTGIRQLIGKEEESFEQVEKSFKLKPKIKNYLNVSLSEQEKCQKIKKLENSKYSLNKYSLILNHFGNTNNHIISSDAQRYVIEFVKSTPIINDFVNNIKKYFAKIIEIYVKKNKYVKYEEYLSFCLITDLKTVLTVKELLNGFVKFVNGFEIIVSNCQTNLFEINFNSFFDLLIYHSIRDHNRNFDNKSKSNFDNNNNNSTVFSKILMFFDVIISSNGLKKFSIDNKLLDLYRKLNIIIQKYKKYEEISV